MSIEQCVVCCNSFDPKANDIAMFEPAMICGNCVQLVRDAYDEETAGYAKIAASIADSMKKFDELIKAFPTKVTT